MMVTAWAPVTKISLEMIIMALIRMASLGPIRMAALTKPMAVTTTWAPVVTNTSPETIILALMIRMASLASIHMAVLTKPMAVMTRLMDQVRVIYRSDLDGLCMSAGATALPQH